MDDTIYKTTSIMGDEIEDAIEYGSLIKLKPDYDKAAKRMHGFDEKYQYTPWGELPASARITFERMSKRIVEIAIIEGVPQ